MKNKEFHKLIEKPHLISEKHIGELEDIIKDNPYFASARLLKIVDLIKNKSPKVYDEIQKSSLYIHDKSSIYDELLNAEIPNNETPVPDISKGPVGIGLGENKIEKNDFTNEILDEINLIGEGVKATVLESFIEAKIEDKKKEEEGISKAPEVKQERKTREKKEEAKSSPEKSAENKTKSQASSAESPKRSLADEVMESLAVMKKEREERLKKMEALDKKVEKDKPKPAADKKTESKSVSKSKAESSSEEKENKKSEKEKKSTESKTKSTKSKEKSKSKGTKKKTEKEEEKKVSTSKVKSDQKIIETFINKNPRIKPPKESEANQSREDLSKPSTELPSNLVSENLANIFEKQGKISKAIAIYKQLILKYPEKKSYFAQKLETLEK